MWYAVSRLRLQGFEQRAQGCATIRAARAIDPGHGARFAKLPPGVATPRRFARLLACIGNGLRPTRGQAEQNKKRKEIQGEGTHRRDSAGKIPGR